MREIIGYQIHDHHTKKPVGKMYGTADAQKKRARTRAESLNLEYGAHRYSADPVWADVPAAPELGTGETETHAFDQAEIEAQRRAEADEPPPGYFVHARDMWDTLNRIANAEPRPDKRGKFDAHDLDSLQDAALRCLDRIRNPHRRSEPT